MPLEEASIHPPIARPGKIIAIGLNYEDHAAETGADIPEKPIVFAKYPNTIIGPGEPDPDPPHNRAGGLRGRARGHHRAGRAQRLRVGGPRLRLRLHQRQRRLRARPAVLRGRSVDAEQVHRHLLSPRALHRDHGRDPDPQNLSIRCILNGEVVQDGTTSKMIFSVAELVSFLSQGMTLEPGDVIVTGTPPGRRHGPRPAALAQAGDEMTIEIEGLGSLTNPVEAE